MTSAFSWQNSISLCPASFHIPRPNLPVTPGVSWLSTFAFQSPIMKRTSSHVSKVMLKILQSMLQQYVNRELPDVQAGFRKGRGIRDRIAKSTGSWKRQESSRKTSISDLLTMPKPLTVWITKNCGKFFKRWEYQTTWPASWETYMQVRKQQLELDMEQQTGSK